MTFGDYAAVTFLIGIVVAPFIALKLASRGLAKDDAAESHGAYSGRKP